MWEAAGAGAAFGALIKLLMLTSQRREKVLTMDVRCSPEGVRTIERRRAKRVTQGSWCCLSRRWRSSGPAALRWHPFVFASRERAINSFVR